jgi:hypothetical protein
MRRHRHGSHGYRVRHHAAVLWITLPMIMQLAFAMRALLVVQTPRQTRYEAGGGPFEAEDDTKSRPQLLRGEPSAGSEAGAALVWIGRVPVSR